MADELDDFIAQLNSTDDKDAKPKAAPQQAPPQGAPPQGGPPRPGMPPGMPKNLTPEQMAQIKAAQEMKAKLDLILKKLEEK